MFPIALLAGGAAFYFVSSFTLGVLHAVEPGHGKTVVAAYLIGSQGKPRHALALGAIVTFTHTVGIILLAVLALVLAKNVNVEELEPVFELSAAIIVVAVGSWMLRRNLRELRHHHHPHTHSHEVPKKVGVLWKDLVFLGISGGVVPCPAAFAVLLASISAGKPENGLLWVLSFSLGLAIALVGIGILVTRTTRWVEQKLSGNRWLEKMPLFSSALILLIGTVSLLFALSKHFL